MKTVSRQTGPHLGTDDFDPPESVITIKRNRSSRSNGIHDHDRPEHAAWANRDGEGFSVKLDLVPINGSEIVIRTPREEREEGGAA